MKIFLNIVQIILVIFVFSCNPDEPTKPKEELTLPEVLAIGNSNKIEIVTWNIEHFPKASYTTEYVKAIIKDLDADIYVLQEIQSQSKFASMLDEMDDYSYLLHTNRTGLSLAVVYKNGLVKVKNSSDLFEEDEHYFAGRPPLLTKLEWQKNGSTIDLTIINLHLKCCGDNSIEDGNNEDEEYRRVVACQLLYNYVSDSLNSENVIVAGDWNDAIQEPESTNVFQIFIDNSTNFKFADMDIAIGNAANWSWQGWSSSYPAIHFDHILINNNLFDELENSAVVDVIKLEEYFEKGSSEYDKNVSDHRPLYFKFTP